VGGYICKREEKERERERERRRRRRDEGERIDFESQVYGPVEFGRGVDGESSNVMLPDTTK
jgi:hypothetical protein